MESQTSKKGDIGWPDFSKRIELVNINTIKPYWRNVQLGVNIEEVKKSIQEFWYNTYLVLDSSYVIINGHSRYKALRALWYTDINVIVLDMPERVAKKYRIIDNQTSELNEEDKDNLKFELLKIIGVDEELVKTYFDSFTLQDLWVIKIDKIETAPFDISSYGAEERQVEEQRIQAEKENLEQKSKATLMCPNCYEEFEVTI